MQDGLIINPIPHVRVCCKESRSRDGPVLSESLLFPESNIVTVSPIYRALDGGGAVLCCSSTFLKFQHPLLCGFPHTVRMRGLCEYQESLSLRVLTAFCNLCEPQLYILPLSSKDFMLNPVWSNVRLITRRSEEILRQKSSDQTVK